MNSVVPEQDPSAPTPFSEAEAQRVRSIWGTLGLPGLIDVHTHFMPRSVMDKVWAYFDSAGPLVGREWPITYRADEDVRVAALQAFGIRAYSSLVYPHKPNMAEWLNGWAADFAAHHPDCLHTATFYPEEPATPTSRRPSPRAPGSSSATSRSAPFHHWIRCSTVCGRRSPTRRSR